MLTVTNVSFLSSQPAQDVSGSKTYVLFGMNVTMLLLLLQFSTSFDLISLQNQHTITLNLHFLMRLIHILFFLLKYFTVSVRRGLLQSKDKHKVDLILFHIHSYKRLPSQLVPELKLQKV